MKYFITAAMLFAASFMVAQTFNIEKRSTLDGDKLSQPFFSEDGEMIVAHNANYKGLTLFFLENNTRRIIPVSGTQALNPIIDQDNNTIYYNQIYYKNKMRYTTVMAYNINNESHREMIVGKRSVRAKQLITKGFTSLIDGKLLNVHTLKTQPTSELYLTTENLQLVLYKNAKRIELNPVENETAGYIWASLSPDRTKILFTAASKGTFVCNLEGEIIQSLGQINAPVWYDNNNVVGMYDEDDGHQTTASRVEIMNINTKESTLLSKKAEMAFFPAANAKTKRVAYCTADGKITVVTLK